MKSNILIEVEIDVLIEIENECTIRGRSISDFFLECYREKLSRDAQLESEKVSEKLDEERAIVKKGKKSKASDLF